MLDPAASPDPHSGTSAFPKLPKGFALEGLLDDVLDITQMGIVLYKPVYSESGGGVIDLEYVLANPTARRLARRTDLVGKRMLEVFPHTRETGVLGFFLKVLQTGDSGYYPVHYREDSLDSFFHIWAKKSGQGLVVSFTDTAHEFNQEAEKALKESHEREQLARAEAEMQRERLHSLFMQAPALISILQGPSLKFEFVNSLYGQLFGNRPLLGKPIREALPELEGQPFFGLMDHVYQTGESHFVKEIYWQVDHSNSGELEEGYYNILYQPIRDRAGNVEGVLIFGTDVTEQVVVRKRIESSEARIQRLLDSIPQIAWTADRQGRNTYLNQKWYEFTRQVPGAEPFREIFFRIIHPEDLEAASQQWRHAVATGEPFQTEYRFRNHEGEYHWMLGRALPLRDDHGQVIEWVGTATDIHEQKQAIDYLYTILEGIPHMAWTSLPEQSFINFYNKRWYDYSGLTEEQSRGQGWQLTTHPDDIPLMKERITAGRQAGQPWEVESRYRRASDGMYRWHLSRAVPLRNESGKITMWVGTATDIHEQKQAQHALENTLGELHEKNFELDQFVYKTSHDLRAPLSTILGLVDILKQEEDESVKANYVDLIENRVHKLDAFIRSMLDYSRNTRTATSYEKIDFVALIQSCLQELEYMKNFGRLRVTYQVGEEAFYSDVFRLKIIFSNLISNAVKYLDVAKQENQLAITVDIGAAGAKILFTDNGLGIEQQYQDRIFNMFFRATDQAEGSGLGLYIVKQAVSVLNGRIRLESKVGFGTQFTVTLPHPYR